MRSFIVAFFIVCASITAMIALRRVDGTRLAARRSFLAALSVVTLLGLLGIAWQETPLRIFATREGVTIRGLIAKPVPNTTDHEYTPRGRQYRYWSFILPASVTLGAIVISAFISSALLYRLDLGLALIGIWAWVLAVAAAVVILAVVRFAESIDLFI